MKKTRCFTLFDPHCPMLRVFFRTPVDSRTSPPLRPLIAGSAPQFELEFLDRAIQYRNQ
jgi:hypothetical protein